MSILKFFASRAPLVAAYASVVALGCSSGAQSTDARIAVEVPAPVCGGDDAAAAAPVACWATGRLATRTGCDDTHCDRDGGTIQRSASFASCGITAADPPIPAPPSTLSSSAGALSIDDDQCAFHGVVVPACTGDARSLSLDVELQTMAGDTVPAGAQPYVEAFLTPVHLAPDVGTSTETTPGRYRIGPVTFDASGTWTLTLHFFGTCNDSLPQSPHAHLTMTLQVP